MKIKRLKEICKQLVTLEEELSQEFYEELYLDCEGEQKKLHTLRDKVVPQVAELVDMLARDGLVTVCAWQGSRFVSFAGDSACMNGGIQLNCPLEASEYSEPPPTASIPGIKKKRTNQKGTKNVK